MSQQIKHIHKVISLLCKGNFKQSTDKLKTKIQHTCRSIVHFLWILIKQFIQSGKNVQNTVYVKAKYYEEKIDNFGKQLISVYMYKWNCFPIRKSSLVTKDQDQLIKIKIVQLKTKRIISKRNEILKNRSNRK